MASIGRPQAVGRAISDLSFEDDDGDIVMEGEDDFGGSRGLEVQTARTQIFETLDDLRKEQSRLIVEAVDCTGITEDDAFLLLRHFAWELTSFEEAFFEAPETVRREAGCSEIEVLPAARPPSEELCGICFCETGENPLPCSRRPLKQGGGKPGPHPVYCKDCWRQYIEHSVTEGKNCMNLRCPAPGCNEALRRENFQKLLVGDALERFGRFAAESLVDDSRGRARWCPSQGCGRATRQPPSGDTEVRCSCGFTWCFACGTDAHLPVSCDTVRKWEEKNRNEAEDATWIKVNTKPCPKCMRGIEKNGGCMHMTCMKPGGCGHDFCWICMEPWKGHRTCNASAQSEKAPEAWAAAAKSELIRYSHYYERYLAHHKAENFAATDQLTGIESVATALSVSRGHKVSDVEFLKEGVMQIQASRRFLKWTYAHAYFAPLSKDELKLFEFHQGQLEGTLERLSDVMENSNWDEFLSDEAISHVPFYNLRSQVISLTSVVREFFSKLRDALQQGTLLDGKCMSL
eukprot:TRINITY_DN76305_c0_g1_i1.p1 TRINITY_DN76305_c0_g1~~TRINITY_DN76305_c0_g1_i1.p1  ORF type:complete len:533 (+),score=93.66 TRINITY_DN76305_c0_g1_i1:50-1600(+)